MNWYTTKLVFRIICGEGRHTPQFEEQIRLIEAKNKEEALEKSMQIGENEADTFFNDRNELVRWEFINVPEINKLPALSDGTEVCSRIYEPEHAALFIDTIHKKADDLKSVIADKITV